MTVHCFKYCLFVGAWLARGWGSEGNEWAGMREF
jgi:hypothetical protein